MGMVNSRVRSNAMSLQMIRSFREPSKVSSAQKSGSTQLVALSDARVVPDSFFDLVIFGLLDSRLVVLRSLLEDMLLEEIDSCITCNSQSFV